MFKIKISNFLEFFKVDAWLLTLLIIVSTLGLTVLFSASSQSITILTKQGIHFLIAFGAMFFVAQIPPRILQKSAIFLLIIGIISLILVFFVGTSRGGATRWLNLGFFMYQPSEMMKIIVPIAIASILSDKTLPPKFLSSFIATGVILLVAALILKQPDLGTAIIIASSGFFVLFFAGFSIRIFKNHFLNIFVILSSIIGFAIIAWKFVLKEYQQQRILTMFNPERDPLGSGYHIIQSKIAIGSGGMFGKGYGQGTQSQLDFLPEHATDFIYATISEEFGFVGILVLLFVYSLIIYRCFKIAWSNNNIFAKLLASSLTLVFFTYILINISMVSGLMPVVGVPLPLISYGGSSVLTLMIAFGIIMSVQKHKPVAYLS
jgi:rod shape determining protein RodA